MHTLINRLRRTDAPITDHDLDELLDILSSRRRRHIIQYLAEHQAVSLSELSEHVAREENDGPIGTDEKNRVWTALYQTHLPTLEEAGMVRRNDDMVIATDTLGRAHHAATALANSYRRT